MISFWFSRSFAPWNYLLVAPGAALLLGLSTWLGPRLWTLGPNGVTDSWSWPMLTFWVALTSVVAITDQLLQNRLKSVDGQPLPFLFWLMAMCSTDALRWSWSMSMASLGLALFVWAWLHFQNQETALSLFGAGLAAGLGSLYETTLLALLVFGVIALAVWHQKSLKRSVVLLLGVGLPWYGLWAGSVLLERPWISEAMGSPNNPTWLAPQKIGGTLPWDWIFLLGIAAAGMFFRWIQPAEFHPFLRTVLAQGLFMVIVLGVAAWLNAGDPWVMVAVSAPLWALWGGSYLQFSNATWINDLLFLIWLVLLIYQRVLA
ncbi:MAG: hypothetical protein ACO3CL_06555 [Bacteroidia bacterium]